MQVSSADRMAAKAMLASNAILAAKIMERGFCKGRFSASCFDRFGNLKWSDEYANTVMTVGKNLALDTFLAGAAYTVTGPYLGLISSVSYSAISAADTMASHSGWTEAGVTNAPTYTGNRKTAAWSSASAGSKSLSAALAFAITGTGTIKGSFMLYGSAATNAVDGTVGTLLSAGLFSGGDRAVIASDTVNVSYSLSM